MQREGETIKDEKTVIVKDDSSAVHWRQMMLGAVSERESTEKQKDDLQEKINKLEEIIEKKDKFVQSTRMILKFRNQHIVKMTKKLNKEIGLVDESDEKGICFIKFNLIAVNYLNSSWPGLLNRFP